MDQHTSSISNTFIHPSFDSSNWSIPKSVIHVTVKPPSSNRLMIQSRQSRVVVINSKDWQTNRIMSVSVNRVSRCGLLLPTDYNRRSGSEHRTIAKNERIIAWLHQVNLINDQHQYAKKRKIDCRCTRQCAMIYFICALILFLIAVIVAILLIIFLMKPKSIRATTVAALRWNQTGITIAGTTNVSGTMSNQLSDPWDVTLDWSNNLFVSDRKNNRIQKFLQGTTNGITIAGNGTYGSSANLLWEPTGLYVDENENIYVADLDNQRIQLWNKGVTFGKTIVSNPNSSLNPYGLHGNSDLGLIFIADCDNHRILSYRLNDSTTIIAAGNNGPGLNTTQLFHPHASFYDVVSDNLLVANSEAHNIVRYKLGINQWRLVAGDINDTFGTASTLLNYPTDVKLDPMGNIYIADLYNNRIQLFMNGQSSAITIVGNGHLNGPTTLALDGQLNLYVCDQNNNRIQKFIRY